MQPNLFYECFCHINSRMLLIIIILLVIIIPYRILQAKYCEPCLVRTEFYLFIQTDDKAQSLTGPIW